MKFVAISDTHCRHKSLKLPPGDVLLHCGDISYKGQKNEVVDFLNWMASLPYTHKIFIAGNHDFYFEKASPAEIAGLLPPGVVYLNDSGVEINGIRIWGSPITPWFFNWAFNRPRGAPIKKHWDKIPADTDILITHGPVFGIHDTVINGRQAGCLDLLQKVKQVKPRVHLCGHIHEAYGSQKKGGTLFINACVLNELYELVNPPVVFHVPARPVPAGT
ncbi:metallophosphatase domain-containing protein [Paraflavisolibacter sp. H34]|uniref:metallophosphatase domain-containing protein n=1 Tax=Huijunlia imazamoxiresistens TaxID=3127457 RepID=UPI00301781FF